ncbi:hypothetical protein ACFL4O_02400 [bacterium]
MKYKLSILLIILLIIPLFSGCKASYSKEKLTESICKLCEKEIGSKIECALKGKTLYTLLYLTDLLNKDMKLSEKTVDIIQSVLLSVNRVTLSTDAEIDFFVVIIADKSSGVEIVFTQYIDDLRRWILSNISRSDFFSRSLTDITIKEKDRIIDLDIMPEISLPDFMTKLVVSLIKKDFEQNMILQILMNVAKIEASFKEGYFNYNIHKLDPSSKLLLEKPDDKYPDILSKIKETHDKVKNKYKFTEFKGFLIKLEDKILFDSTK